MRVKPVRTLPLLMLDGPRAAKLLLLVGGLVWLGGWSAWLSRGVAPAWVAAMFGFLVAYGGLGALSYRGARARYAAAVVSAALTGIIAWFSFSHIGFLAGGVAVTVGCVVPPRRP